MEEMSCFHIHDSVVGMESILSLLNQAISSWPYRNGATNIYHYSEKYGFELPIIYDYFYGYPDDDKDYELDVDKCIYTIELLLNLIIWLPEYLSTMPRELYEEAFDKSLYFQEIQPLRETIDAIIEGVNLCARYLPVKKDVFPQIILVKRDVDLDTALEAAPDLAETLLSYLDVRNRNDLNAKKLALKVIADYLEPNQHKYKGTMYAGLCDSLFFAFNRLNIRHSDSNQVSVDRKTQIEIYDRVFYMALHLIRADIISEYKDYIDSYK